MFAGERLLGNTSTHFVHQVDQTPWCIKHGVSTKEIMCFLLNTVYIESYLAYQTSLIWTAWCPSELVCNIVKLKDYWIILDLGNDR